MKRLVLSAIFSAVISVICNAQPTFTSTNLNPVSGDVFKGHRCDTAGVHLGASGASATWNFASVVDTGYDTTTFVACTAAPYCDSFTGGNIAFYSGLITAGNYSYIKTSTSSIAFLGTSQPTAPNIPIKFSTPLIEMFYPVTYLSTQTNPFLGIANGGSGILLTVFGTYQITCDAYGTLILPSGTYNNVLRLHSVVTMTDTGSFMGFPISSSSRSETYSWFTSGFHDQLMSIAYDTTGTGLPHVTSVTYYTSGLTTGTELVNNENNFSLYPNPAEETIHVNFELVSKEGAEVIMTDVTGRTVYQINEANLTTGKNELAIPVENLPQGMYIVQVHCNGSALTRKVVVNR